MADVQCNKCKERVDFLHPFYAGEVRFELCLQCSGLITDMISRQDQEIRDCVVKGCEHDVLPKHHIKLYWPTCTGQDVERYLVCDNCYKEYTGLKERHGQEIAHALTH